MFSFFKNQNSTYFYSSAHQCFIVFTTPFFMSFVYLFSLTKTVSSEHTSIISDCHDSWWMDCCDILAQTFIHQRIDPTDFADPLTFLQVPS